MTKINVLVQNLSVGLHVSMPSGYIDHPFMFNSFEIKDTQQIVIIKKMGLVDIEVDVDKSQSIALKRLNSIDFDPSAPRYVKPKEDLIPLTLDQLCRKSLIKADQLYKKHLSMIQEVFSLTILDPEKSTGMADLLIGELQMLVNQNEVKLSLVVTDSSGERIYQNALNTLVMILLLTKEMNLDLKQQNIIAQVAVFHNFGELFVPEPIRLNHGELSKPEVNYLKQHPIYAQNKLKETNAFNTCITSAIASHHERLDGSGYPKKLKGNELSQPVQMITVVDAFEELMNNRDYSKRISGNIAAVFLVKNAGIKFNAKLVDALIKITGIYPPGTFVKLDGHFGVVVFSNGGKIKQPIIKLYDPLDKERKIKFVDVSQLESATIECIKKQDLPEDAARLLGTPFSINFSLVSFEN